MSKATPYSPEQADQLDRRHDMLRANLDFIAQRLDRTQALYPMMARVIFQDFEPWWRRSSRITHRPTTHRAEPERRNGRS